MMIAGGGTPAVASYLLQDKIAVFARVCSYDRPGLGWSDAATARMSLNDHISDLDSLLAKGGVTGPLILAPESFGALIAIGYAERHPDRVAGIVFIDGSEPKTWFDTMPSVSPIPSRLSAVLAQASWRVGAVRLLLPALSPAWVAALPAPIRGQFDAIYSRPSPGYDEAMVAFEHTPPGYRPTAERGVLGATPILVIRHGVVPVRLGRGFDAGWSLAQARLLALTSGPASMTVAQGAGHQVAQERPELVATLVERLVHASVSQAKSTRPGPMP